MLPQPIGIREHRSVTFNATTSIVDYGALNSRFDTGPCSLLIYARTVGAGEGSFGYICAKTPSASINGFRFYVDHNAGSPRLSFAMHSGAGGAPQRITNTITDFYGRWRWLGVTFEGGLSGSGIRIFMGDHWLQELTYSSTINGSTALNADSSNSWVIGNRAGTDRTFNGDLALLCRWNHALSLDELNRAIQVGPLSVQKQQQIFMWFAGKDRGPFKLRASSASNLAYGRSSPYIVETYVRTPWASFVSGAGAQTITLTGIASEEVFGSHVISAGAVSIVCDGIASSEAFGSHALSVGALTLTPSGIASEEAFGSHTVIPGVVSIVCDGIATAEAFGDAIVSAGGSIISASGIASEESFGTHAVVPGAVSVVLSGIASAEAFGDTSIAVGGQFITASGIASEEAFGAYIVTAGGVTIVCSGIASLESFGVVTISGGAIVEINAGILLDLPFENRLLVL